LADTPTGGGCWPAVRAEKLGYGGFGSCFDQAGRRDNP
jgi:hypothetical protein